MACTHDCHKYILAQHRANHPAVPIQSLPALSQFCTFHDPKHVRRLAIQHTPGSRIAVGVQKGRKRERQLAFFPSQATAVQAILECRRPEVAGHMGIHCRLQNAGYKEQLAECLNEFCALSASQEPLRLTRGGHALQNGSPPFQLMCTCLQICTLVSIPGCLV